MREYILKWINQYRDINSDLFYDKASIKDLVDAYGINQMSSRRRWPKGFDFAQLPDDVLIVEYTQWLIKSFRQR